jgi:DNA-binding GntR family transcriptional regulator
MPQLEESPAKYLQIANYLREAIISGDLPPGAELPSERQIAQEWQVSRPTATRAFLSLRQQGLVESRQGAGTYVRDLRLHRRAAQRYHRYRERGAQYAADERLEITAAEITSAPDYVVLGLGLQPSEAAMVRRRVISREGVGPIEIATSWWPATLADVAPRLLERRTLGGIGSVRYVESVTGRQASYARDRVSARLASAEELRDLGLRGPAAVLVFRHVVYDTEDSPIEFTEAVYPPGQWTVEQEYAIEADQPRNASYALGVGADITDPEVMRQARR